jgi:cysteine-rich repeat protein
MRREQLSWSAMMRGGGRLAALAVLAAACSEGEGGRGGDEGTPTGTGTGADLGTTVSDGSEAGDDDGDATVDPPGTTTSMPTTSSMPTTGDDSGGSSDDGVPTSCGDGGRDPGEACDDGNDTEADGCNSDCTVSGSVLWSHVSAGTADQAEDGYGVAAASGGAAFVAGDRFGTTRDLFLRGYTPEGGLEFTAATDGPSAAADAWHALAIRGDTLYAAGFRTNGSSDVFVATFDVDGTPGWTHAYDDPVAGSDVAHGIAVDPSGNVVVAGTAATELEGTDGIVQKLTPAGGVAWTRFFTTPGAIADEARAVAADFAGNVIAAGSQASGGQLDIWVRKYDADGATLWTQGFGGADALEDRALGLACAPNGDIVVTGYETTAASGTLLWLRRYDLNGNELWTQTFAGAAAEGAAGHAVAIDTAGDIIVVGRDVLAGLDRVLVRKYGGDGSVRWSESIEGAAATSSVGRAVTVGPDEHLWIAAGVDKGIDGRDVYIAQIAR